MKRSLLLTSLLFAGVAVINSQEIQRCVTLPQGKEIYIPNDLKGFNFNDSLSQWNYHNMSCTDNFVILWDNKFGDNLSDPPKLENKEMKVSLDNLRQRLEQFYTFYRDELKFVLPGSKSEKYRMMLMLNYSLEGTAYGGDYDGQIGAMWVTPNRVQDERLNCIAHELGHSFQAQISCDKTGEAWGGCGFFEMTSQWMLWHVNPLWIKDELYHWQAFTKKTHKAYLHLDNIYHSPYVLEYWSQKHGLPVIADLYRAGKKGEDPITTYKRMFNLSQDQFCDEMYEASARIVNLDFNHAFDLTREYANQFNAELGNKNNKGWQRVIEKNCPENYGFNAIPIDIPNPGKKVAVSFQGETDIDGYRLKNIDKAGWRYGFVAVTEDNKSIYGETCKNNKGKITFKTPKDIKIKHLWLVVMGAPKEHYMLGENSGDHQWPYSIKIEI